MKSIFDSNAISHQNKQTHYSKQYQVVVVVVVVVVVRPELWPISRVKENKLSPF